MRDLGIVVAAVRYRLEDAHAGLLGLVARAGELGVDADRIAVGGASAGGGLAAALALLAHDRGEVRAVFQLPVYPMLDDRTVTRTAVRDRRAGVPSRGAGGGALHRPGRDARVRPD